MFICEDCGCVFEEGPCPNCNSENYEEAYFCKKCSTWHLPDEMQSYGCCKACVFENMDEDTMRRYIAENNLEASFYVEFCTGSEFSKIDNFRISGELIDICKADFYQRSYANRIFLFENFINQDRSHFAEWLECDSTDHSV